MKIILFIEDEQISHAMTCADLTDGGTKAFGTYVSSTVEKEGNVNKLIQTSEKFSIAAAYCNGKVAIRPGIKSLSDGTHFISVDDFGAKCKSIENEN